MRNRKRSSITKSKLRSALANGSAVLAGFDHRSAELRRLKDLIGDHVSDLGGHDHISHSERLLANRASMLALLCELTEQEFARAKWKIKSDQMTAYQTCVNSLRRVCQTLGLARRQKPVPSLADFIREHEQADDAEEVAS